MKGALGATLLFVAASVSAGSLEAQVVAPPADTVAVYGWVRGDGDRPVDAAEVRLAGSKARTVTDSEGFFVLPGALPGPDTLVVTHLSYADRRVPVTPTPGYGLRVVISLDPDAIEVEGVIVQVRPNLRMRRMAEHQRRREVYSGVFMSATQLEGRGMTPMGDLLSGVPGVKVDRDSALGAANLYFRGSRCNPRVWIDGREAFRGAATLALAELRGSDLEALEIYRAGEAPADLAGDCLTIVAWLSRGGG